MSGIYRKRIGSNLFVRMVFIFSVIAIITIVTLSRCRPPEWELFDLEKDPYEVNNVYSHPDYADTVRQLKQKLARLQREVLDEPVEQID
ncbi:MULTISPECIES: sulfatase/phosphatase domain-containing protein [unclassified Paenibacillus]|uniref:sulfatase/phosphatase domain-containing protein n=1 Tax=unclassified Paenibacillus TaxID=185978 RepID=UPI001C101801|nr:MULTISPECIES: sulfatase/phosphatase domain-containing protein [unclassified Paenibacillus]MBU5441640.1 DUF4976 domain-containing protein [Paenibacillus sp. MSJ-34]